MGRERDGQATREMRRSECKRTEEQDGDIPCRNRDRSSVIFECTTRRTEAQAEEIRENLLGVYPIPGAQTWHNQG